MQRVDLDLHNSLKTSKWTLNYSQGSYPSKKKFLKALIVKIKKKKGLDSTSPCQESKMLQE